MKQPRTTEKCRANTGKNTIQKRRFWNSRSLVWGSFLLFAVVGSIYAAGQYISGSAKHAKVLTEKVSSKSIHNITPKELALSGTEFGQFPPSTEAERELEKLLHGKDENIDLALVNWLIAADVPQFSDMTRETYFAQLGVMISQVRQDMAKMQKVAESRGKSPNDPDTHCAIFCNAIIKLHFAYTEEFRQDKLTSALMKGLYSDANNILLAGLFRTHRGSCVSMPLIYLVIGQRLGLPVHLVAVGKHYFVRWEEPRYHMNIETTIVDKVSVTPDDSVYLDIEGMTREQLAGSDLRNLSNREVVGNLFFARSAYWATKGSECKTQQCLDLSRASHLSPDDPGIKVSHQAMFSFYGIKPGHKSLNIKPKT